ncbi:MAG: phosphoribosyltransferase [Candidatus Buchananbacteria bacterium RBG_13_36_9]|uniref:Phosphoribosyltransferase n=1 Tax=Candidatus Buchananbacteria bacterium RBG_13_36_9 TaxID=1797530 RepID=A0A1G1XPQ6_9BACT|nr:MAG: phosphoribosyltransferase [Candidatus Buchananbacteria bacterium RBG_13_36_9]
MLMIFKNRQDAGQKLAEKLKEFKDQKETIILALPRGGVVTAFEIAKELNLPLDLVVPRKIGAPHNEEYAIGAITESGEGIFNQEVIDSLKISKEYLNNKVTEEKKEAERRLKTYRQDRPILNLENKTVIIVDDGIATGLTMRAAIKSVREKGAKKIIVAVPVSAKDSLKIIQAEVDKVICLDAPLFFGAVGAFYEDFGQTSDEEVIELMEKSKDFGK